MPATVNQLADELVDVVLDRYPVAATVLGIPGRDDKLRDLSEAGEATIARRAAEVAARAEAIDPGGLSPQEAVTRAVILQQAATVEDASATRAVEFTVTDYLQAPLPDLLMMLPMIPVGDDAYLGRLSRIPAFLRTVADRHRAGIAAGRLPVRHQVRAAMTQIDRYLADPANDPMSRPRPAPSAGAGFEAARERLLSEEVRPAIVWYRDVLSDEIEAYGRTADRPGLSWLPDGDALYAAMVRINTTTDRAPEELHQTGLDLIARLTDEYREIGEQAFGTRDVDEIRTRLRTDPAMRYTDEEDILSSARAAIARAEAVAPAWFGRLPSSRCQVEPVPAVDAPGAPRGYYMQPALDGSRPGVYYANTYKAEERDRYTAETLAFHEAVPGHHFQLTIAQELPDLPLLRRVAPVNAYSEGWGLYAERLADEMGLFSSPITRLGMLAEDSVRAARLVVDTGLHAKGWSRQQVVDYLTANTVMPELGIETETDRYIADPGQALSYMVGRLEIQRLREEAARTMGDRFDVKGFHDTVLGNGPLPMSVLSQVIRAWATS